MRGGRKGGGEKHREMQREWREKRWRGRGCGIETRSLWEMETLIPATVIEGDH